MASKPTTIALVTGGNQGVGLAVATSLAKDHGYHVILGARRLEAGQAEAAKLTAAGYAAEAVQLDVTSDASINAAVATIADKFGRLDVLVNNAGTILDHESPLLENGPLPTRELFEKTFQVNVIGVAVLTESLLPLLRKAVAPGPRLVFVTSTMGSLTLALDKTMPWYSKDFKAYDSSKAALNMLTINYARILSDVGGKSNAVCPGYVNTRMNPNGGSPPEVGALRIVEMATIGADGPTATFSRSDATVPW